MSDTFNINLRYVQDGTLEVHEFLAEGVEDIVSLSGDLAALDFNVENTQSLSIIKSYIQRLDVFEIFAFYLIPDQLNFELSFCHPESSKDEIEQDVNEHIARGSFAWALNNPNPTTIYGPASKMPQVLLPIATRRRIHGMFVGVAKEDEDINGISLNLLRVILSLVASRFDNYELTQQMHNQNKLLEVKVKNRTQDLEVAIEKSEAISKSRSEFLANMSHEIRTPMNGVLGTLELLRLTQLDNTQRNYVEMAYQSGDYLLKILNDILDLSKFDAGKIKIENVVFNLYDAVNGVMNMFSNQTASKGIELDVVIANSVPEWVSADSTRLLQVLINLVGNALKFTSQGYVHISVSVQGETEDGFILRFEVKDSGIGISEDAKGRIFNSFEQADGSTTRKYGGTGLGLSLSQRLVELLGGKIGVDSKEREGSTFWFTTVATKADPEIVKACMETESARQSPAIELKSQGRILIVEDNIVNQRITMGMIESFGLDAVIVNDGNKVLDALRSSSFELVLMDVHMPTMNGYESTKLLRSSGFKELPVIALTADVLKDDVDACFASGMNDYLSKPINIDQLKGKLAKWMVSDGEHVSDDCHDSETETEQSNTVINSSTLSTLRTSIGDDVVDSVLNLFMTDSPSRLVAVRDAFISGDSEALRSAAHGLKGSSLMIGADELSSLCAAAEEKGRKSDFDGVKKIVDDIEVSLTSVIIEIGEILK